jgi:hypothetical protein
MFMNPSPAFADDVAYYRQVLHGLIDAGADLAKAIQQRACASDEPIGPDVAVAFDRVARAVRRCVWLAQHLADAPAVPKRQMARRRIIRAVEDAIQRDADPDEANTLNQELRERLDAPDLDDDIDHRPIDEIIAEICHDLGLGTMPGMQPWKRRQPADVRALWAVAARDTGPPWECKSGVPPRAPAEDGRPLHT